MLICFNGIDGSGKSTQAQRLVERLNAAGYPAVYVWSGGRRMLRRPLIALLKRRLRHPDAQTERSAADAATPYQTYYASTRRVFRKRWLRTLWLHSSLAEHALELWLTVGPPLLRGQIVVCDRYLHDSIVRLAVLAGLETRAFVRLLRAMAWYPTPRLTRALLIDVPAEVAFRRKQDIADLHFLRQRIPLYHALATTMGMRVIDGTEQPEAIAAAVWQEIAPLLPNGPGEALPQASGAERAEGVGRR